MRGLEEMLLARVIDACDGIDGRVKLQKIVYLLKVMGYNLPYNDFRIRQQGPYSRAVACDTDLLTNASVVEEKINELGPNESGEPIRQYLYTVLEAKKHLVVNNFEIKGPDSKPPVAEVAGILKPYDRAVLEIAATKVFLERHDKLSGLELQNELQRLKGHLSDRFKDADQLLSDLSGRGWLQSN